MCRSSARRTRQQEGGPQGGRRAAGRRGAALTRSRTPSPLPPRPVAALVLGAVGLLCVKLAIKFQACFPGDGVLVTTDAIAATRAHGRFPTNLRHDSPGSRDAAGRGSGGGAGGAGGQPRRGRLGARLAQRRAAISVPTSVSALAALRTITRAQARDGR